MTTKQVIVVGAGWAGLSCAFYLAKKGHRVTVLEAAPKVGGRARGIAFGETLVDNGQHILLGAYQNFLKLLDDLDIAEEMLITRLPLNLMFKDISPIKKNNKNRPVRALRLPDLFPPLHILLGFLVAKGFSLKERFAALYFCRKVYSQNFQLKQDVSLMQLLTSYKQPLTLIKYFWEPLALASLSTPIHYASAQVFLNVLKDSFTKNKTHSDILFPKHPLSDVLPNPIVSYLKKHNHAVLCHQRAQALIIKNGMGCGIQTDKEKFFADGIVLATPPSTTAKLLSPDAIGAPIANALISTLQAFTYQPITTAYLRFAFPVSLKIPMMGLSNSLIQWVFDRATSQQSTILSAVITGNGPHIGLEHKTLIALTMAALKKSFPNFASLGEPLETKVVTEKQAAFSCVVGIDLIRPDNTTPIPNLWLAGDYTRTGYPATLEGALKSGKMAAQLI